MRKESEKHNKVISVRMTEKLHEKLKSEADEKGIKLNSYITDTLEHHENSITPEIAVTMQNIANTACESAPDKKELIHKEMNKIWQSLK